MSQDNASPVARTFLQLRDHDTAHAVRASLFAAANAVVPSPLYIGSVHIPDAAWNAAHAVGGSRMLLKALRGQKASESQGERALALDTEGALAELLVGFLLEKAPGVTLAPLVAHKPDSAGLDVDIDGLQLDVKSVGQAQGWLNINAAAHQRKPPALYLAVKFTRSDVADLVAVPAEAVGQREQGWALVAGSRGAPFYSCRTPLPRLEALPEEEAPV